MDAPTATAAPAAPVADTPATMPATHAAVVSGSTLAYREAKRAERAGKPLPAVAVAPEPVAAAAVEPAAAAAPTPPPLTRKERDQQEANERTRRAVEAATADLRAENDRLKASTAAPRSAPAPSAVADPPAAAPEKFPSLDVWAEQNPGKTFDDYLDARDDFRTTQHAKAQQVDRDFKARAEELTKRGQAFSSAMSEAITAEPDLAQKVPPAMRDPQASIPLSALSPEQMKTATFSNLVAEAAVRAANGGSGKPAELLKYLHTNQAEAVRIAGLAQQYGPLEALFALERIDERIAARGAGPAASAQPAAKSPKTKTLTSAPAPQETLGHRPSEQVDPIAAAVKSGDTRAYRQLRREQRAAGQR